jgi:hypothetical protein
VRLYVFFPIKMVSQEPCYMQATGKWQTLT